MTPRQLNGWLAYHSISPIGERREDTRSAIQTYYIRQALTGDKDAEPSEFRIQLPIYEDEGYEESLEEAAERERREASQFA